MLLAITPPRLKLSEPWTITTIELASFETSALIAASFRPDTITSPSASTREFVISASTLATGWLVAERVGDQRVADEHVDGAEEEVLRVPADRVERERDAERVARRTPWRSS